LCRSDFHAGWLAGLPVFLVRSFASGRSLAQSLRSFFCLSYVLRPLLLLDLLMAFCIEDFGWPLRSKCSGRWHFDVRGAGVGCASQSANARLDRRLVFLIQLDAKLFVPLANYN
jgi:hypothetical protein